MPVGDAESARSVALTQRLQAALGENYVVERKLGAGGFAVVFLVRDLSLKRYLAVKVVSPELIYSESVLERFRREAETVAQLSHPNIVPLHFIGQQDDYFFLAMGYVDGGSLEARISSVPGAMMPLDQVRRAMCEVAGALAHAHRRGVTHRDIKPQNVLIDSESGRCLLTDFGIARTIGAESLTATGLIVGTPAYISPEQLFGGPSDHRADIYALGVLGYEMATGDLPFHAQTPTAMMMKRLAGPPPAIGRIRPDVPHDLEAAINGCLATDPADRYQSAEDVVAALGGGSGHTGGGTRIAGKRRGGAVLRWGAGIGLMLCAGALAIVGVPRLRSDAVRPSAAPIASPDVVVDAGMVALPAGEYTIGDDGGPTSSHPRHAVRLPAFGIDLHEVTIEQFTEYVSASGAPAPWGDSTPDAGLPVTGVRWSEASNYCRWRHPAGGDLPSEEQWEAAARGLSGRRYPWGEAMDSTRANIATRGSRIATPGGFPSGASPEGVHDLIGNVWEWTRSALRAYPGGTPMPDSLQAYRVIRGGAYSTPASIATTSRRGYSLPDAPRPNLAMTGFRCVMPVQ